MLKKIDNHEIMTQYEAARLYRESEFVFIITDDKNLNEDDIKGYVVYTYDRPWDLDQIPDEELKDKHFGFFHGYAADYPQVGGEYYGVKLCLTNMDGRIAAFFQTKKFMR